MTGWSSPATPPGPVAWELPDSTPGPGVRQMIGGSWRLYKSAGRRLLLIAAVPALIQTVLTLPGIALVVVLFQRMFTLFRDSSFLTDPQAVQAQMEAAMRPPTDLTLLASVTGGAGITVLVIGWAGLTTAALAISEGRTVSVGSAYRPVFERRSGILIPAVIAGVIWALVNTAQAFLQPTTNGLVEPGQTALYSLIGLLFLALSLGTFVLVVVCCLGLPAILVEGLDLRHGLVRGAQLTRGTRFRLGLAFIAIWILQGLSVGILALFAALIGGVLARSLEIGVATYAVISIIGAILWLPLIPALLALLYRDRTDGEGPAADAGPPDVEATPGVDGAASLIDAG